VCSNTRMERGKPSPAAGRTELLRQIPSVDELLRQPRVARLGERVPRALLADVTREVLASVRGQIAGSDSVVVLPVVPSDLEDVIAREVELLLARSLQGVINATGVILHTNLGRAPLAAAVIEELRQTTTQYSNLEYDLEAGERGKRDAHTSHLLARLTGAEDAIVVNNGAAAILLVLAALASDGEVLVSRGELIEIGDGFRIPEVMAQSGAVLREIGTTNRTHLTDYENALNERTRLLLRVYPSNFRISGFTEKPTLQELAELARRSKLPLVEDLGSGCLIDLSRFGISEPTVRESMAAGADVVTFSGDKLLGGPQAGIVAGRKELVQRVRRHPLFRALRVDKLTITALEVTLGAYLRGAWDEIPALAMLRTTAADLERRSRELLRELTPLVELDAVEIDVTDGESLLGGGSTPAQVLPGKVIRVNSKRHSATQLEKRLRGGATPVIARVEDNKVLLDLRTVFREQEPALAQALAAALR